LGLDESVKTIAATALPEYEPPQTDITQLDPYLAAISRADFQLGAFVTEFLFHLAFTVCPLLALLPVKQLRIMAKNRSFLPGVTTFVFIMQSCLALSVILVNVLVLGFDCRLFTSLQLGIFNATVLLRLIVIAAKYSYMSPLEYTETLTSTETSGSSIPLPAPHKNLLYESRVRITKTSLDGLVPSHPLPPRNSTPPRIHPSTMFSHLCQIRNRSHRSPFH
ncbi:hypothetical protein BC829DRAFT_395482, partial [Chytridium lagenaria]